jgi:transcriptional regulator of acetoin/glycerol metabolism
MSAWQNVTAKWRNSAAPVHNPQPLILDSWRRCRDASIDPAAPVELRRVEIAELLVRQTANRQLIRAAAEALSAFSAGLRERKHVVYITDADGIVLFSRGSDYLMQSFGLRPGFDWSEVRMGTNGAGTALAADAPVAVVGPDHWLLPFREASCLGAPIHTPDGRLIAAVDLSTHVSDCEPDQLAAVIDLAASIERALR